MRRLIVNADDLGFTSGVNRAILEAHAHGIVTSSTLMATGTAFSEAVQESKTAPRLSVGCHVVLIDGQPALEAGNIPTLTSSNRFRDGLKSFPRVRSQGASMRTKLLPKPLRRSGSFNRLESWSHTLTRTNTRTCFLRS